MAWPRWEPDRMTYVAADGMMRDSVDLDRRLFDGAVRVGLRKPPPHVSPLQRMPACVGSWDSWETKSPSRGSRHEMNTGELTRFQLRRTTALNDFARYIPLSASTGDQPGERVPTGTPGERRGAGQSSSPTPRALRASGARQARKQAPSLTGVDELRWTGLGPEP